MNQLETIETKVLSPKHKLILIGLMLLVSLLYISELSNSNVLRSFFSWLGIVLSCIYLWQRPEVIDLKRRNFTFKRVDGIIFLAVGLLGASSMMPV